MTQSTKINITILFEGFNRTINQQTIHDATPVGAVVDILATATEYARRLVLYLNERLGVDMEFNTLHAPNFASIATGATLHATIDARQLHKLTEPFEAYPDNPGELVFRYLDNHDTSDKTAFSFWTPDTCQLVEFITSPTRHNSELVQELNRTNATRNDYANTIKHAFNVQAREFEFHNVERAACIVYVDQRKQPQRSKFL